VESVLGVVTAVTSESIGAVVSVSPSDSSDSSDSSVPPSIPSSFEDEVLHHAKKMWSKSIRKNKLIIVTIGNYILSQRQVEYHLWNMVSLVIKPQMYLYC